jgi:heme-degrading monooxygenase HmoA
VVARIWRGWTSPDNAADYARYVQETGLAAYRATPGNRGAHILTRDVDGRTEFLVFSFWDSLEAVRSFAGNDIEQAVFYPEDERYLVDRELTVSHYDVVGSGS